jgi:hypothetical protein
MTLGAEQAGARQGAEVLDDRLARHRVVPGQLRGAHRAFGRQAVEKMPACRICQRGEDVAVL